MMIMIMITIMTIMIMIKIVIIIIIIITTVFDEVEHKPNFGSWLPCVGLYSEKPTFL